MSDFFCSFRRFFLEETRKKFANGLIHPFLSGTFFSFFSPVLATFCWDTRRSGEPLGDHMWPYINDLRQAVAGGHPSLEEVLPLCEAIKQAYYFGADTEEEGSMRS